MKNIKTTLRDYYDLTIGFKKTLTRFENDIAHAVRNLRGFQHESPIVQSYFEKINKEMVELFKLYGKKNFIVDNNIKKLSEVIYKYKKNHRIRSDMQKQLKKRFEER